MGKGAKGLPESLALTYVATTARYRLEEPALSSPQDWGVGGRTALGSIGPQCAPEDGQGLLAYGVRVHGHSAAR